MPHSLQTLIALGLFYALAGCQSHAQSLKESPSVHAVMISHGDEAKVDKSRRKGSCNKLPDCRPSTVFPERALNSAPKGTKGCRLPTVIARGAGLRPKNTDVADRANVWVAVIVPAEGGRPVAARVVGSNDFRFEAAAYEMAMSMVYRPQTCNDVAYETFLVAPFVFGPRPLTR